jgi:vacuolar-type H+-ATPase subunit H|tara:strand:- start:643 stop:1032 length:390 start_codon:yes stop_codon:yes gene_type:complete
MTEKNIVLSKERQLEKNIDDDYNYARATYYQLLERGKESLDLMIEVARESEHPRAFEVLSNMMKQMSEINDKLMDHNKKEKELTQAKADEVKKLTQNNIFLGSTSELQKFLKKNDKEEILVNALPRTED